MIIWVASYPKSGNTWIRSLLSSYFYSKDGKFNFDLLLNIPKFTQEMYFSPLINPEKLKQDTLKITEYWEAAQLRINIDNQIKFFKTHNACVAYRGSFSKKEGHKLVGEDRWFTTEKNTLGYIYIVRDPRTVACSLASHLSISTDKAVDELLNENSIGYNGPYKLAELPGSWKINYLSWKKKKKFEGIVIKYENLIDNTEKEFTKILNFLQKTYRTNGYDIPHVDQNKNKMQVSINSCKFSRLKEMEEKYGFKETVNNKFFRLGKKDNWKNELSINLIRKIEKHFKNEMKELGYL